MSFFNITKAENSYQEWHNLYIAKEIYRNNMNNIYKCAILKSQNNAYTNIREKLKTQYMWAYDERIGAQQRLLSEQINRVAWVWCSRSEKDSFQLKKQVLDTHSFEMCRYLHFLEYVQATHINNLGGLVKDREISKLSEEVFEQDPMIGKEYYLDLSSEEDYEFQNKYTVGDIIELERKSRDEINEEIEHTKNVYKISFQTYANYESNMVIHLLLNMLESDFISLRNKIYSTLSPINQVVYKIANATSK